MTTLNHDTTNSKKGEDVTTIKRGDYRYPPKEGFILTHFLSVVEVKRSAEFYLRILGGNVVREGKPTIIQIANSWLILNLGGGHVQSTKQLIKQAYDYCVALKNTGKT